MTISVPVPDLNAYETVARPNADGEGHWAGAPSVAADADGDVWLAYRLRDRERRGHNLVMARSEGGGRFQPVRTIAAAELGAKSIERAAITFDPATRAFSMLISYDDGRWRIGSAAPSPSPGEIETGSIQPLNSLFTEGVTGVKDPYVFSRRGETWMLYTAYVDGLERLFAARHADGGIWEPRRAPLLESGGWHRMFTRPSCAFTSDGGVIILYEGCTGTEHSPIYNIRVGAAYTEDMTVAMDLTPDAPLLESPTPGRYATLRYLAPLQMDGELSFFYEAACPDDTFELRRSAGRVMDIRMPE